MLHYTLTEKIGEGGMGSVWRATDTTLNRDVAIKLLPQIFADTPDRMARFEREAQLLASLNHPNIASIYGLHEEDGQRFLAMELVEGEDLAKRLERGPLPVDQALDIAAQMAAGIEAAHERPCQVIVGGRGAHGWGLPGRMCGASPASAGRGARPDDRRAGPRAWR